jgi:hypothetical protein
MAAYLYFALNLETRRIKIGCTRGSFFSTCPVIRVRAFGEKVQFLGCLPLTEGADDLGLKRQLQARFEDSRDEGDWFFLSQALKDYIWTETRGHICELCAGETVEKQEALNKAANAAVAEALGGKAF